MHRTARTEKRRAHVRFRQAAAGEAEVAPHIRASRAPIPQTYAEASRSKGVTGERLLQLLESRLDTVSYRMGFGASRTEARQIVRHNGILVNGRRVNMPSYQVRPGDTVEVAPRTKEHLRVKGSVAAAETRGFRNGSRSMQRK